LAHCGQAGPLGPMTVWAPQIVCPQPLQPPMAIMPQGSGESSPVCH